MNTKQKVQTGFSLIELMFAVAIIGIISSFAIPTYQDFTSKAQIQSAYQELSNLKEPIDITSFNGDQIVSTIDLGWQVSSFFHTSPLVVTDSNTGALNLEAVIDGDVQATAKGVKIILARGVHGNWSCKVQKSNNNTWKDSFLPGNCESI